MEKEFVPVGRPEYNKLPMVENVVALFENKKPI